MCYEPEDMFLGCQDQYFECDRCEEKEDKIDTAKDFMTEVIDILYGYKEFDEVNLENALDEVCAALDIKLREGKLAIKCQREKNKFYQYLSQYI